MKTTHHFALAVLFLMVLACEAYGEEDKPAIDPSEHRAAIRQKLLQLTPLGEPFANVIALLNENRGKACTFPQRLLHTGKNDTG